MNKDKADAQFDLERRYEDTYSRSYNTKKGRQHRMKKVLKKLDEDWSLKYH